MDEALEVRVGRVLRERRLTVATAESCTGGLIGHRITEAPGSSDYYVGSIVAYSNEVKMAMLDVSRDTLAQHGAVSRAVAREMARGARAALAVDLALSVTGIAGPSGGTAEKPVGLTYVGLAAPDGEWVERHVWPADRHGNKIRSAEAALDLLQRYLAGEL